MSNVLVTGFEPFAEDVGHFLADRFLADLRGGVIQ